MSKKVLVIDDDSAILEATSILLESEGYEVTGVSKPELVLSEAQRVQPDLILLDVLLSGKDGRELAKKLKSDISTQYIPIILLSAYSGIEQTYHMSGANDFISKPFEIDILLAKVAKYTTE